MKHMSKLYDEKSIESLSPLAFTRLRPGVYAGDTTYSTQLVIEIVSNSVDEFRAGNGNKISVTIKDDTIIVEDNGQGFIPNSFREDGKTILEAAFSVLNTSGKYREGGVYEGTSLGSFGIGCKIATYLAHWLEVITYRDGQYEHLWFKEGVFDKRDSGEWRNGTTGTLVQWQASEEFFTHPEPEVNKLKDLFKTIVCLCPGLTIVLDDNGKITEFYSKNGLSDLADAAIKDKEIIKNRFSMKMTEGKNKADFILTYTSNYSPTIVPYVNTGLTERGPHITQIKTVITREFNKFFKEKKWLKDKDENLSGEDIQEGMYIVFNLTAPNVAYDAQVKSTITKIDMSPFTQALATELQIWLTNNEKEVKSIADKAIMARKAREAAKKAREATRNNKTKKEGLKAKMELSDKLIPCTSKDVTKNNLLIVEGLSAGSSALEARNPQHDSIMMLRGKCLSVLKCDTEKVLANKEYNDIISTIGAGFGDNFDVNKMQYNKIVITSDQDSDGANIELLLITFFYTYMRPLVEAGKLYRAMTPLYIVDFGKGKREYFYSESEFAKFRETNPSGYELIRAKGLGALDPATLKEVCFDIEKYKQITVSDVEETYKLLEILMGKSVEPRKQFIYDNATEIGMSF